MTLNEINKQGISIIIGARDEFPQVAMTIANLTEDMYASGIKRYEIILMDNGSRDETTRFFTWRPTNKVGRWTYDYSPRGMVAEDRLRIYFDPVLSNVGTRNKGVEKARYENIIFSDAHIIVRPGTVKGIIETLDTYKGIVHSPISWMGASSENPQPGMQYSYKVGEKIWGCVDEETQILTDRGWKSYNEVTKHTNYVTVNMNTQKVEIQESTDLTVYHHDGDAYEFDREAYDLLLTPNHRCVVDNYVRGGDRKFKIKEAQDLTEEDSFPLTTEGIDKEGEADKNLIWTLAAVVCDGNLYAKRKGGGKEYIGIVSKKSRKLKKLKSILDNNHYSVRERVGGTYYYQLHLGYSRQLLKYIPNKVFTYNFINSLSRKGLEELQKALIFFDGNVYKKDVSFSQVRKEVSEIFEYINILIGKKVYTYEIDSSIKKGNTYQKKLLYKTYVTSNKIRRGVRKSKVTYKGVMWCPTVPNGTIFVKRGGKSLLTANTWNKSQVADTAFYIPFCGHAFLAVKKEEFQRYGGYPPAQRVYGGGEPHLDTKYWMLGSTSMMDPNVLIYHLSAGRGYNWNNDDLIHNMFLVSYILGGEKWADRIRITYYNKSGTNTDYIDLLYNEAIEEGEEERRWLDKNKKYSFEEVLGLDKEDDCTKCTKRGRPDPHPMRVWDYKNDELHGTHRSWVQEFKLTKDNNGNIFIGNTPITHPKAIKLAEKYI